MERGKPPPPPRHTARELPISLTTRELSAEHEAARSRVLDMTIFVAASSMSAVSST